MSWMIELSQLLRGSQENCAIKHAMLGNL